MAYTAEEVLQYVAEEEVKSIRLVFCDVFGTEKNITLMPAELERAFKYGIAIDASAIPGFDMGVRSDLLLRPDPSTLCAPPYRPESGKIAKLFCNVCYPDGTVIEADSRKILQDAIDAAAEAGVRFDIGPEMEFYIFKADEDGNPTGEPYDYAAYMDVAPVDKCENLRREICNMLEDMDIRPECSHHEEGPGQNEIDFRYSEPMKAADNATTFKSVVRTVAARNGLYADFSPKPLPDSPGSGLHINFSINDRDDEEKLMYAIAGIMDHIATMTVFLNPTEESYARLGTNKAPAYVSWSHENRSQLIRIPATPQGHCRAELRSPDPAANPYIAFALMIYAAIDGIIYEISIPKQSEANLFDANESLRSSLERLPRTLERAKSRAATSKFIKKHLPQSVIDAYCGKDL